MKKLRIAATPGSLISPPIDDTMAAHVNVRIEGGTLFGVRRQSYMFAI
jgi:hypothetical protein